MKYAVVMAAMLLAGCASSDIRNWNTEAKTGRIVVFSGENLFSPPTIKDAHDDLMEKCPSGYEVLK